MVRGVVLVGLASLAVAGCESVYSAPQSGPRAQVAVTRALLSETQQAKLLYRGADRSRRDWFGEGIFYEYDKTWPVAAETRTEFEIETLTYAGYTELYCSTFYSFTPKSGRSYSFAPVMPGRGCSVAILDKETGKAPSDLVQELAPAENARSVHSLTCSRSFGPSAARQRVLLGEVPPHLQSGRERQVLSDPATGNIHPRRRVVPKTGKWLPVCLTTLRQVVGSDIAGATVVDL